MQIYFGFEVSGPRGIRNCNLKYAFAILIPKDIVEKAIDCHKKKAYEDGCDEINYCMAYAEVLRRMLHDSSKKIVKKRVTEILEAGVSVITHGVAEVAGG